jgi:hypothetical protein
MHSLQKVCPFGQHSVSMSGLRQRQQASKGLMESFPSRSRCVPYPSLRFSSYVKKARSLLFFECRCGIFAAGGCAGLSVGTLDSSFHAGGEEKDREGKGRVEGEEVVVGWARVSTSVSELGSEPSPCVHALALLQPTAMPSLGWSVEPPMGPYHTARAPRREKASNSISSAGS